MRSTPSSIWYSAKTSRGDSPAHHGRLGTRGAAPPHTVASGHPGLQRGSAEPAAASGVPSRTVADFELGNTAPRAATTNRLRDALEAAGVEFIADNGGGAGVRLRRV